MLINVSWEPDLVNNAFGEYVNHCYIVVKHRCTLLAGFEKKDNLVRERYVSRFHFDS